MKLSLLLLYVYDIEHFVFAEFFRRNYYLYINIDFCMRKFVAKYLCYLIMYLSHDTLSPVLKKYIYVYVFVRMF